MPETVICFDLETVPDLAAVARVHGLEPGDDVGAQAALGGKFPKLPYHAIACIGALIAERVNGVYEVRSLGAPHAGERTEAELIQEFADKIASLRPRLVTFNGASFDMPVLRYRAMTNRVCAPGLDARNYYHRYSTENLDLCDVLSCFDGRGKMSLNDLCRALDLPGKPNDIDGSQIAEYIAAGRVSEVAAYCESDVVSTFRLYLRYELFRGALTFENFEASEENLATFLRERLPLKPHLAFLLGMQVGIAVSPAAVIENVSVELIAAE